MQVVNFNQKQWLQDFETLISEDKDYYVFRKNNYFFRVRRINNNDYRLRVIKQAKYKDILYFQLKSLEEVKNTILQYF